MSWSKIWDDIYRNNDWGKYPEENLIRFIAQNFKYEEINNRVIRVLEVGCGTGANLWYICREGFKGYGIDGSEVAIDRAKDRLQRESLSADFVVGDMMNLPWTDNYFDVVIDIEAIYANTLKDSKIILSEIDRILKPSGVFYSKSVSDRIYKGKNYSTVAHNEYSLASDGPLANLEIARVMSKKDVYELYGDYFKVEALDLAEVTRDNDSYLVSEWLIRCAKKT